MSGQVLEGRQQRVRPLDLCLPTLLQGVQERERQRASLRIELDAVRRSGVDVEALCAPASLLTNAALTRSPARTIRRHGLRSIRHARRGGTRARRLGPCLANQPEYPAEIYPPLVRPVPLGKDGKYLFGLNPATLALKNYGRGPAFRVLIYEDTATFRNAQPIAIHDVVEPLGSGKTEQERIGRVVIRLADADNLRLDGRYRLVYRTSKAPSMKPK